MTERDVSELADAFGAIDYAQAIEFWYENVEPSDAGDAYRALLLHAVATRNTELVERLIYLTPVFSAQSRDQRTAEVLFDLYFKDFNTSHEPILEAYEGQRSPELLRFFERAATVGPPADHTSEHPNLVRRAVWAIGNMVQPVREKQRDDDLARHAHRVLQELAEQDDAAAQPFAQKQLDRLAGGD